jgi:hypothetical protein
MAAVHGAMLSARAYGDPKIFGVVTGPLLDDSLRASLVMKAATAVIAVMIEMKGG